MSIQCYFVFIRYQLILLCFLFTYIHFFVKFPCILIFFEYNVIATMKIDAGYLTDTSTHSIYNISNCLYCIWTVCNVLFYNLIIIKMKNKELLNLLEQAQTELDNYNYNACISTLYELQDKTENYDIMQDFIDRDIAEDFLKHQLEEGGIARLYYAMGDIKPYQTNDYCRIDAYGNLAELDKNDLQLAIDEFKDVIEK